MECRGPIIDSSIRLSYSPKTPVISLWIYKQHVLDVKEKKHKIIVLTVHLCYIDWIMVEISLPTNKSGAKLGC